MKKTMRSVAGRRGEERGAGGERLPIAERRAVAVTGVFRLTVCSQLKVLSAPDSDLVLMPCEPDE